MGVQPTTTPGSGPVPREDNVVRHITTAGQGRSKGFARQTVSLSAEDTVSYLTKLPRWAECSDRPFVRKGLVTGFPKWTDRTRVRGVTGAVACNGPMTAQAYQGSGRSSARDGPSSRFQRCGLHRA